MQTLSEALRAAMVAPGLAIDGLGVERVDAAVLRLLVDERQAALAAGVPVAIVGSAALHRAADAAGLDAALFGEE